MRSKRELRRVEVQLTEDGGFILPEHLAEHGIRLWQNTMVGIVLIPLAIISRNIRHMSKNCRVLEVVFVRFADERHFH